MREESVARRYAAALFQQVQRMGRLDEAYREMLAIGKTVEEMPQLRAILRQPLLSEARKKSALQSVFGKSTSGATIGFLNLLVDKRRINLLEEVVTEFVEQVRTFQNVQAATAVTAIPLSPDQINALVRSLETRTGKTIELHTAIDPDVLGGVLVRIGDTVLDGTVRGNLDRLRERLLVRH